MAYVDPIELSDYLRSTVVADEVEIAAALSSAEAAVNSYCYRSFAVPTVATTRTFVATSSPLLWVPDIANTTNLVITSDGATVAATDYQLEVAPGVTSSVGLDGRTWPYTCVRILSGSWAVDSSGEALVSITARWGWAAIPSEVELATKLLARDYLLARDTGFGILQTSDGFSRRIAANSVVADLLAPLRRVESYGIA